MPDETRVFDVAKPGRSSPNPTSKPIIVGHQPTMTSDPMFKDKNSAPMQINVTDSPAEPMTPTEVPKSEGLFAPPPPSESDFGQNDSTEVASPPDMAEPVAPDDNNSVFPTNDTQTAIADDSQSMPASDALEPPMEHPGHVESLQVSAPKRRSPIKKVLLGLLVLLVAGYLFIDSNIVKTGINLPFHIFKQKTSTPAATAPTTNQNQAVAVAVPVGFTDYKIDGTSVTFAAPTVWGTPTSSTDQGFSARGATNKSDGAYAYLVDFATNKDVEIAVTSSKYLPAARATLYYDFLQWCVGTNDGKFYEGIMHFTTANKIDTPSTTSCDQGPVDAIKLDTTTIVQTKAKAADGKVIGDIYTKNTLNSDLPVFRVKDVTSTNSDNIKQLIATVKVPATTTTSSSSGQ